MKEASYYHREEKGIRCELCPQNCLVHPGCKGFCRARVNENGRLYTMNYAEITGLALDPIEKKPLYHFYPGAMILSCGTFGCNLACPFCQNWEISQGQPETERLSVDELTEAAACARKRGNIGVAFTYSEPGIWFEYVREAATALKEAGLHTVMVSNGYLSPAPVSDLLPLIDAWNIDLKSIRPGFYRKVCKGKLEPVLETISAAAGKVHLELTTLIIPGLNDSEEELHELSQWVARVNPEVPLHFSRYFPGYKMALEPTGEEALRLAYRIARKYLKYVYIGNLGISGDGADTACPDCGEILIERQGYKTRSRMGDNTRCIKCGADIPVVM
ncbi:MAG: AmmeMemoRadiSam system radical SAM enzyme [Bacillota bacterium]